MADSYYLPKDGLFHWNKDMYAWERLNREIKYKGCVLRSITYHSDWTDPAKIVNHREWRITFPDGHEGHFGSVKQGGSLKELKDYIDWKERHGELRRKAHILVQGSEITPETAMKWFCWHEIVNVMEKDITSLDAAISAIDSKAPGRNIPDWEYRVLIKFLELTNRDLIF